ncbi:MAG: RDD family protein [Gammaproteobacteria bacterium]|nr:RDD family protein [Gammaproteobacteria bacterium]
MENKILTSPVSLLRRIAIMFYDSILLIALLFFASLPIAIPLKITMEHPYYPLYILYIHVVAFLFFGWCWTRGGQTLGSKTWKIRVISDTGNKVTWKQAFLRYMGSILCWLSLGIGFLWCYTNKERRAWNDILSKTRLSRVNE